MEAICLSSSDIRMLDNCMNRAIYKIFGVKESQCQELIKLYVGLHNVKDVIVAKHCKFIVSLLRNMDSANVLYFMVLTLYIVLIVLAFLLCFNLFTLCCTVFAK